jgi:hypothetical protein
MSVTYRIDSKLEMMKNVSYTNGKTRLKEPHKNSKAISYTNRKTRLEEPHIRRAS